MNLIKCSNEKSFSLREVEGRRMRSSYSSNVDGISSLKVSNSSPRTIILKIQRCFAYGLSVNTKIISLSWFCPWPFLSKNHHSWFANTPGISNHLLRLATTRICPNHDEFIIATSGCEPRMVARTTRGRVFWKLVYICIDKKRKIPKKRLKNAFVFSFDNIISAIIAYLKFLSVFPLATVTDSLRNGKDCIYL